MIPQFGPYSSLTYFVLALGLFYFVYWYLKKNNGEGIKIMKIGGGIPFTTDLTEKAREGQIDPVIGRTDEISRAINILSRRNKNNPLLVGPAGVGKTAVVEGLALKIATGDVPVHLAGKRMLSLSVPELLAGTKYRGDFEARVQSLIQTVFAGNRSIILFIDEIHVLVQTKGTEGAINVTDILKPALARGDLQVIGATSFKEYQEYILPDEPLERRFQVILVDEPTVKDAIKIVNGIKANYEDYHNVTISKEAVEAAVKLSHEYIKNRKLPDKAIDLIDEAGAELKVREAQQHISAVALMHSASVSVRCDYDECPVEMMDLKRDLRSLKAKEKKAKTKKERETLYKQMIDIVAKIEAIEKTLTKKDGRPEVTREDIRRIVAEWVHLPLGQIH